MNWFRVLTEHPSECLYRSSFWDDLNSHLLHLRGFLRSWTAILCPLRHPQFTSVPNKCTKTFSKTFICHHHNYHFHFYYFFLHLRAEALEHSFTEYQWLYEIYFSLRPFLGQVNTTELSCSSDPFWPFLLFFLDSYVQTWAFDLMNGT